MQFKEGMRVRIVDHESGANFKCQRTRNKVYTIDLPANTVYIIYEIQEDCTDDTWGVILDAPAGYIYTETSYVAPAHIAPAIPLRLTRRHT